MISWASLFWECISMFFLRDLIGDIQATKKNISSPNIDPGGGKHERTAGLRFVIESRHGFDVIKEQLINRLGSLADVDVEPLFPEHGNRQAPEALRRFSLAVIRQVTEFDVRQNIYDIAYGLRDAIGAISIEPDRPYRQDASASNEPKAPNFKPAVPTFSLADHFCLWGLNPEKANEKYILNPPQVSLAGEKEISIAYLDATAPGGNTGNTSAQWDIPLPCTGSARIIYGTDLARNIHYSTMSGADIIVLSRGCTVPKAIHEAMREAIRQHILLIVPAGHDSGNESHPTRHQAADKNDWLRVQKNWSHAFHGNSTSFSQAHGADIAALWLASHGKSRLCQLLPAGKYLQDVFGECLHQTACIPQDWDARASNAAMVDVGNLLQLNPEHILSIVPVARSRKATPIHSGFRIHTMPETLKILGILPISEQSVVSITCDDISEIDHLILENPQWHDQIIGIGTDENTSDCEALSREILSRMSLTLKSKLGTTWPSVQMATGALH
jgi:hypothetical protein